MLQFVESKAALGFPKVDMSGAPLFKLAGTSDRFHVQICVELD